MNYTTNQYCDNILYPLGTSFLSVADFSANAVYTEDGNGAGSTSLGLPTSSAVVGNSIITVFPAVEGLIITQNITVAGTTAASSVIEMNVRVENTNSTSQKVGIRYLWDTMVGGYDGTWLRQYDGTTAGTITGYETDYNPPAATFTSYAMGGCSQDSVTPPPWTCNPADFGPGSGTFSVFGSISSGPGATTPARFIYGFWEDADGTAYTYTPNTSNEIGSYIPNNDDTQDSSMLYYFANQTIPLSGTLSDQADISNAQCATQQCATTTTTLSGSTGTVSPGTPVTDTATVTSTTGTPTGSVQFYLCGPTVSATPCTSTSNPAGSAVLVSATATSAAESPSTAGFYCWAAVYTPDTLAFTGSSSTTMTNECFQVVAPTTTTTTSSTTTTVAPSTSVTDTAVVAAVPPMAGTPTGSVQFYFCGPTGTATSCAAVLGNAVGSPVPLSGGSAISAAQSPSAVGFYCWSAIYTPGTSDFTGSSSTTTENECFQVVAPTTTTTTTTTTTVVSPTTTTQTASTTSTSAPATTTTTSLASTTGTATSTSFATSTAKSTTTIISGNCYDPEVTVTSTATHFTTITQTTTATYYATATGTQTVTATSTATFTTTTVVPVTTTITEVSSTTECSTTVSSSSSTVIPPLGVPEFPVPGIAVMLAAICLFAVVLFRRSLRPTTKARV